MTAQLVKTTKTEYSEEEMISGFILAWVEAFGKMPLQKEIAVIWAQNAIETGSTIAMWNNNIGNVKYHPSNNPENDKGIKYMMLANTWEILNGKKVIFQPPHKATWFRAFNTLAEGISFHLLFLKNSRYKTAWKFVEDGNPILFAHELKRLRYYTADANAYAGAMKNHFDRFMRNTKYKKIEESIKKDFDFSQSSIINNVLADIKSSQNS